MISVKPRATRPVAETPPSTGLPPHFSFSSMSAAQQCLRKWRYHYLDKVQREFISSSLLFGIAIHTGVQEAHQTRLNGHTPNFRSVMSAFERSWQESVGDQEIRFAKDEDKPKLCDMAKCLFKQFLELVEPGLDQILAIEEQLSLRIPGMSVPVVGRLDLLVEHEEYLVVVDTKSARNSFNDKVPVATGQLALYSQALTSLACDLDKPFKGRFVVFRKLKAPKIEVVDVPLRVSDKVNVIAMVKAWWQLIEAAHKAKTFPPNPGPFCRNCEYQTRCAAEDVSCPTAATRP